MSDKKNLLLLGFGQVAKAIWQEDHNTHKIIGTTRNPNRLFELLEYNIEPIIMPLPACEIIEPLSIDSDVVVSFPPDGYTDSILAPASIKARSLIYVSSTTVYGCISGIIDDTTSISENETNIKRIQAENIWRKHGATILRAPGIYGPQSGLHKRLKEGTYKIPNNAQNMVSRIHVHDLACIILAILKRKHLCKDTYIVGDLKPCSHMELVTWLCNNLNLPMPEPVSPTDLQYTLRGNRAVDSSSILNELGITLRYPDYKAGYTNCLNLQELN